MSSGLRIAAAITLGMALTSCGLLKADPPGGISRAEAEAIALQQGGDAVLRAEVKGLRDAVGPNVIPDSPNETAVWAVVISGTFVGTCPARQAQNGNCPPPQDSALVVLDFKTGDVIVTRFPAEPNSDPLD